MAPRRKTLKRALSVAVHAAVVAGLAIYLSSTAAQNSPRILTGYITTVRQPNGFDVYGKHVITTADTNYGPMGLQTPVVKNGPMRNDVSRGAYVEVSGVYNRHSKVVTAHTVLFRESPERKIDGLGVIVRVISPPPQAVIAVDGYRIRITAATKVRYPKAMKSLADVHPGLWVLYEGKLNQDGLLVASKLRFLETEHAKAKDNVPPQTGPPDQGLSKTPNGNLVIQPGKNIHYTAAMNQGMPAYPVSENETLQERINRIGMSLIPAYQKELPENDPLKIHFFFYAVDDPMREVRSYPDGHMLISAIVAARLKNDDQLAAVLADGIALCLQGQTPVVIRFIRFNRARLAEAAGVAALNFVPYAGGAAAATVQWAQQAAALREQRARVALQLMAEAGYNPWQAPEAWRLVGPFKLPQNLGKLKYPAQSQEDFEILHEMYGQPGVTNKTEASSMSHGGANGKP